MDFKTYSDWTDKLWIEREEFDVNLAAAVLGLTEEAGEVAGKVRKYFQGRDLVRSELVKELGDVFFFWTRVAKTFGITLEEAMKVNVEKLEYRQRNGLVIGEGDNR